MHRPTRNPFLLLALCFGCLLVPSRLLAQPVPEVTVEAPGEALLGGTFTFKVTFANTGDQPGYGPYVLLCLPVLGEDEDSSGGPCDGISFASATALFADGPHGLSPSGSPAGGLVLPSGSQVSCTGLGELSGHPLGCQAGLPSLPGADGCQMVVLTLPFGSFFPDQPPVEIEITVELSDHADVGVPLPISVQGGFQFGADPTGGEDCLPGAWEQDETEPSLLIVNKSYQWKEDETASGPNFPRRYCLEIRVADGQLVQPLTVEDDLPSNLVYLGPYGDPPVKSAPPLGTPGGMLELDFGLVDGSVTPVKTFCFDAYVPSNDATGGAVLTPQACKAPVPDVATAAGSWTPLDTRDPANQTVTGGPADHLLTAKCLATQKSAALAEDEGAPGPTPGDVLVYSVDFQVSDYFQVGELLLDDVLSDGLELLPAPAPTLTLTDKHGTTQGSLVPAEVEVTTAPRAVCGDGTELLSFKISQALKRLAVHPFQIQGLVTGGEVTPTPPPSAAATGTLTYHARILDAFFCPLPTDDSKVDKHDVLANEVLLSGEIWDPDTGFGTGHRTEDDSRTAVAVVGDLVRKEVYARNGDPDDPALLQTPPAFAPGDTLTFRITYPLPSGDAEALRIQDFLPDPVLEAVDLAGLAPPLPSCPAGGTPPPAGQACIGNGDTLSAHLGGSVPRPWACPPENPQSGSFVDGTSNSLCFLYGDVDDPANQPQTIELLFTLKLTDQPFTDQLQLTNEVVELEENSRGEVTGQTIITQFELGQPVLEVEKGVVAACCPTGGDACRESGDFTPPVPASQAFTIPGGGCPRYPTPLTSADLAAGAVASDLLGHVQPGDRVTFALVVENVGSGLNGAFDVTLKDTLPAGFSVPAGGLNLCVTAGTGETDAGQGALSYVDLGGGLFGNGIQLDDGSTGSLGPGQPADATGANLAVVTYDLVLDPDLEIGRCFENTGVLATYAGTEGGPDHLAEERGGPLEETAQVCIKPGAKKSLTATSEAHTAGSSVAIGEVARFRLEVQVPEGSAPAFEIADALPPGLRFLDDGTARVALVSSSTAGLAVSALPGLANVLGDETTVASVAPSAPLPPGAVTGGPFGSGTDPIFALGDLENRDEDCDDEFVVVEFNALVENQAVNQAGHALVDRFGVRVAGAAVATSNAVQVGVAEPRLSLVKELASRDGDLAAFTLTLTNTGNATAWDVVLEDALPPGLALDAVELPAGVAATNASTGSLVKVLIESLEPQQTAVVKVLVEIAPAATCLNTGNRAEVTWTSLPGPRGTLNNPTGSETPGASGAETGERDGSGGVNDYRAETGKVKAIECPDLAVGKSHAGEILPGGEVVYTFTLANEGSGPAQGPIVLEDLLPPGLQVVATSGDDWVCTPTFTNGLSCEYTAVPLEAGAGASPLTVTVTVSPDAPPLLENCARVELADDPEPANNEACDVGCKTRRYTYTTVIDFEEGLPGTVGQPFFQNTLAEPSGEATSTVLPSGQLELVSPSRPFPFLWVAASSRGTIVRIDTASNAPGSGAVLGEYLSSPDGMGRDPSRTTVEPSGSVWVTNRAEGGVSGGEKKGSVTRVGILVGTALQRFDKVGTGYTPNAAGEYVLTASIDYTTCDDKDGDGYIRTSSGLGNILPWTNGGLGANGPDTHGGVSTAEDECIVNYTRVVGENARAVVIDGHDGNIWVGGFDWQKNAFEHEKLSGATGQPLASGPHPLYRFDPDCGGYGGVVDANGVLWSARGAIDGASKGWQLLRYDPKEADPAKRALCIDLWGSYGLALDSQGFVWNSRHGSPGKVAKLDPAGNLVVNYDTYGNGPRGVAVTTETGVDSIWFANSYSNTVTRIDTQGLLLAKVPVGATPTGLAVDAAGKVWVTNRQGNSAQRIRTAPGNEAVEHTVDLGAGAGPYNYSDMTGAVAITYPAQGFWVVEEDSGRAGREWCKVCWNREKPSPKLGEAEITVEFKAADTLAALSGATWVTVPNCVDLSDLELAGRYFSLKVTMKTSDPDDPPIVTDLEVQACCPKPLECEEDSPKALAGGLHHPDLSCDEAIARAEDSSSLEGFHYRNACGPGIDGELPEAVLEAKVLDCRETPTNAVVDVEVCCPPPECPDPADPEVHYVSQDPQLCAVIKFTCQPGQMIFGNACGCGCLGPEPPPRADLHVTKSLGVPAGGDAGQWVFTITVTNEGPADATDGFTVTDPLPPGLIFESASAPGMTCSFDGEEVTCERAPGDPLAVGESVTIEIFVSLTREAFQDLENCATVESGEDPNDTNDRACLALLCPDPENRFVHYLERDPENCGDLAARCHSAQIPFWGACGCGCIDVVLPPPPPPPDGWQPWRFGLFGTWPRFGEVFEEEIVEGDLAIDRRLELDSGFGPTFSLERRLSRRLGVELSLGVLEVDLKVEQRRRVVDVITMERGTGDLRITAITLGPTLHLTPDARADLHLTPQAGYAFLSADPILGSSVAVEDGFVFGVQGGLDLPLPGRRWSVGGRLQYLRLDTEVLGQGVDLDWTAWSLGLSYGF